MKVGSITSRCSEKRRPVGLERVAEMELKMREARKETSMIVPSSLIKVQESLFIKIFLPVSFQDISKSHLICSVLSLYFNTSHFYNDVFHSCIDVNDTTGPTQMKTIRYFKRKINDKNVT